MDSKVLKIALLGTRGVPASHGGFETCVEEVGARLVELGHNVTVYCKPTSLNCDLDSWKGMRIVRIPRIPLPGVETLFSTLLSVFHSLMQGFDVHMVFNSANALVLLPYKVLGKRAALNTDGLEWKREKWGYFARSFYHFSEWFCSKTMRYLVSDSQALHVYYKTKFQRTSRVIAYGANLPHEHSIAQVDSVLAKYGLTRFGYFFQVTRFEPENNPLLTALAIKRTGRSDLKCVIVGGSNYATDYSRNIQAEVSAQVVLPGFIYDRAILEILMTNALAYVHGNSVGGTNPALLQAMAAARPILALDCEFNRETLQEVGYFFERDADRLALCMCQVAEEPDTNPVHFYQERIREVYNWDAIARQYEALFVDMLEGRNP